jgi:hypothetical protein
MKEPAYLAAKTVSRPETRPAVLPDPIMMMMRRHVRSINFKALNLHLPKQSPQAVQRSGCITATRIPVSSSIASSTWRVHRLTQRRQPMQRLSSTQTTLFLFFCFRYKLKEIHRREVTPIPIYTTFIFYYFLRLSIYTDK